MKIIAVGATGTLGQAVAEALTASGHDVVAASRKGELTVDLTRPESIAAMYAAVGPVDAVVSAAGVTPFVDLTAITLDHYRAGLDDKLLGQIELVRQGIPHLRDGGSFTLISGVLADDPILTGTVAATVNGGLHAFVRAAANELPRGIRINVVSPTALEESWSGYAPYFPGHRPIPAAEAARLYVKSVLGGQTGQVFRVGY